MKLNFPKQMWLVLVSLVVVVLAYFAGTIVGDYLSDRRTNEHKQERKELTDKIIENMQSVQVGAQLRDRIFEDLDDHTYRLSDLVENKNVFMLMYIGSHCKASLSQLADFSLSVSDSSQRRNFIVISPGNRNDLGGIRKGANLKCPILIDENGEFGADLNIHATPLNIMLTSELKIADVIAGQLLAADFEIIEYLNDQ